MPSEKWLVTETKGEKKTSNTTMTTAITKQWDDIEQCCREKRSSDLKSLCDVISNICANVFGRLPNQHANDSKYLIKSKQ